MSFYGAFVFTTINENIRADDFRRALDFLEFLHPKKAKS
jgi:hypothetical protein